MRITEEQSDTVIVRIVFGFDPDHIEADRIIQREQHRLTSNGFAILGHRQTDNSIDGTCICIEANRFLKSEVIDG